MSTFFRIRQLLVKGDEKEGRRGLASYGIELTQQLHPEEYESGKEFEHEGGTYCVEIKRTPILVDENGNRFEGKDFAKVYAIDDKKAELTHKQSELTAERRLAIAKLISNHPYLQFNVKRTLKVKR